MSLRVLDSAISAAVLGAASQEAQLAALIASWAGGNVTARLMAGDTLLATLTHGPWVLNSGATPRTLSLGSRLARTFVAIGAPTRVVFRAGSTDVFQITAGVGYGDVVFAASVSSPAAERIDGLVVTAVAALPASGIVVPPGVTLTSFSLTAPSTGTHPYTLGHAFKQGDLPAGSVLDGIQTTIKSTWPDGSARWAVLAGTAPLTAGVPASVTVRSGSAPGGAALTTTNLKATGVTAAIDCGAFGAASWAGTDWDTPQETWVSGPAMSSWRYRKAVGADAHLVGWLEVRLWASGAVEVLPWIENGYLNVAAPTNKSETYSFTLGGTSRFSAAIDLPNHTRTPLVSGAALAHWLGTDPGVVVKHDAAYMMATEMVPTYGVTVSASATRVLAQPTTYTPLQQGTFGDMGLGYDGSLALIPEHDMLYLVSDAPGLWASVQRMGYSAGRYALIHRDETTQRPPAFSRVADWTWAPSANLNIGGYNSSGLTQAPAGSGTVPPYWDVSHHPSMGYFAALITGRAYHVETTQFVAHVLMMRLDRVKRGGAAGLYRAEPTYSLTRETAWALRSYAQAAAITPDASPLRDEYLNTIAAHATHYRARYVTTTNNPFGFVQGAADASASLTRVGQAGSDASHIQMGDSGTGSSNTPSAYVGWTVTIGAETRTVTAYTGSSGSPAYYLTVDSPFSATTEGVSYVLRDNIYYDRGFYHDFLVASWGYAKALDLALEPADATLLDDFYTWHAQSIVGRFGGVASTEYLWRDAATYDLALAPSDSPDFSGGTGPWFANWGAVWTATQLRYPTGSKTEGDGTLRISASLGTANASTGYWANLIPALAYAVRHGIAGALAAWNKMTGATDWPTLRTNAESLPVYYSVPAAGLLPTWRDAMADYSVIALPTAAGADGKTTLEGWNPRYIPEDNYNFPAGVPEWYNNGFQCIVTTWCGAHADTEHDEMWWIDAGGHADYGGNERIKLVLNDEQPRYIRVKRPSGAGNPSFVCEDGQGNTGVYADGETRSTHTYNKCEYVPGLGPVIVVQGGTFTDPGAGTTRVISYDRNTGASTLRAANPFTAVGSTQPGAAFDPTRGTMGSLWWRKGGTAKLNRYDVALDTWYEVGASTSWNTGPSSDDISLTWHPADFLLIGSYRSGSSAFVVFNCAAGTLHTPTFTGSPAGGALIGRSQPRWVPALNAFALWDNSTSTNTVTLVNPPGDGNYFSGAWTITTLAFSGPTVSAKTANGTYGRFVYLPRMHGFVLVNSTSEPGWFFALQKA